VSARPHSASCLGKGLDCNATLVKFPGSFEPAASSVISCLRLCLRSRLATVDESPASDSNERERQQADREDRGPALGDDRRNPFHARGKVVVFVASVRECMRWTSAKLSALEDARTPVQCVQKIS
jgi:hypothetical protein